MPERPARVPLRLGVVLGMAGASAVVAQVVLLRELLVAFGGNEMAIGIMLAAWLLWTALGSGLLSRLPWKCDARSLVAGLQVAVGLLLPCTVWAVRASRGVFHAMPGEILEPVPVLAAALAALAPFCSVSGWLFAAGARLLAQARDKRDASAVGSMYLLEAIGSAVGGMFSTLLLLPWLDSLQIASLVGIANLATAVYLAFTPARTRIAVWAALVLAVPPLLFAGRKLDRITIASQWPGFRLLARANSRYGDLAVIENEAGRSLIESGLPVASVPDPQAAEETVHFALLQHPAPRSVLLIGGGLNGSLQQALRHTTVERVDYVELDPEMLRLAGRYFPREWALTGDPRVHVHSMDGRLFLRTAGQRFDVIITGLPGPHTAQLNRFYTREFFDEAAGRLAPGGVLSFQLQAAENYLTPQVARLLRSARETLRQSFAEVAIIPGGKAVFLASNSRGILTTSPAELAGRLRARNLQTAYVREYYLPFRLAPDRVADLEQQLASEADARVNRDFVPLAYYQDVVLWSGQFSEAYQRFFAALSALPFRRAFEAAILLMLAAAGLLRWRGAAGTRSSAAFCVAAMGFTLLALEVLLLLGFQAIYGYVYGRLAIIIAAFMAGMALGARRALRRLGDGETGSTAWATRWLVITQFLAALSPLLLYALLVGLSPVGSATGSALIASLVFPLLAVAAGALGGYQFPLANYVYFTNGAPARPGTLYALDLAGACAGALLISAYLVPVFGFLRTGELIAVVNVIPAAFALLFSRRAPAISS